MTTSDRARRRPAEARPGSARPPANGGSPDAGRSPTDAGPPTGLPERLLAAREDKGVDLARAERDTKIRARYLSALERGDWRDLPGSVYTKGFLRNYAQYLGLDPDEILEQWRAERGETPIAEPVIVVPRPIPAPRQRLTFSPGIFVAALLAIGVLAFVAYLAIQLMRFSRPPTLSVTDPATAVSDVEEGTPTYVLRGTSQPGVSIVVAAPGEEPRRTTTAADGTWAAEVELRRGRNQFDVTATDPETGKSAEQPARIFITVPFTVAQAPSLTVDQPADDASFENGAIPVEGTATNATSVTVSATYLGPAPGEGSRTGPAPSPPAPEVVDVDEEGVYQAGLDLTTGRWSITVTASSSQARSTTITRSVTVQYRGVNLVVEINGGPAWIKVWVDGELDPTIGAAGTTFNSGRTLTFTGQESVEVRTGSSGVTYFTLNGTPLGRLGRPGVPETWRFQPGSAPVQTQRR
ncbi:MAG: helix-turn-helix domain-containing protein [Chloroflexi bacterium]|nr:helix-turn-helix domain-containing protein [Chloroflexota bacterium]